MATTRALILAFTTLMFCLPASANEAGGHFSALDGVLIDHAVTGDVVVLAGDIELGPNADVDGHVVALLGTIVRSEGARVSGRTIAIASLASLVLEPGSDPDFPLLDAAVRLLSSGGWLLVTTLFAFIFPYKVREGRHLVAVSPARTSVLGLVVVLSLFTALVAVLGLGPALGVPLAAALMIVFFALKAIGLTVIGAVLTESALDRVAARRLPLTFPVFCGVGGVLLLRLVPVLGGPVWTLVSIVSLGAGAFVLLSDPPGLPVPREVRP